MNCIVTAGPTYEPLDQVRRLTNFSTGQLGVQLANHLVTKGHRVTLLRGYYAVYQGEMLAHEILPFTTTSDLAARLRAQSGQSVGAVFHAAAVSDFAFGKVYTRDNSGGLVEVTSGKFSTRQGSLLVELVPTPKLLPELCHWFPDAWVVGWKYEVDGTRAEALAAGSAQLHASGTHLCVVNGAAYGSGFGLLAKDGSVRHAPTAACLFEILAGDLSMP
jgi:phosphopantothenate---cysteine ligase (CTP)